MAKLLMRQQRKDFAVISTLLTEAQNTLAATEDIGMQGATWKELANLASMRSRAAYAAGDSQWTHHLDAMQHALARMEVAAQQSDSPILQVNMGLTAFDLHTRHGIPFDTARVKSFAALCLQYGYGGQAKEILQLPNLQNWLSDGMIKQLSRKFGKRA